MISQVVLTKLIAVGAVCSMGVGYVVYEARTGNGKSESEQSNALIMNAGMFAASHVSSYSSVEPDPGYGKHDGGGESDAVSLMGASGGYSYSRVGKTYE
jgi:hypothetical protein